jgi:hypothetical protein
MEAIDTIRQWFGQFGEGSLQLPDRWYGRPYDNLHQLTSIVKTQDVVTLTLDSRLVLQFYGLKAAASQQKQLVIGPFDRLHFEWMHAGPNPLRGEQEYCDGVVTIHRHPAA